MFLLLPITFYISLLGISSINFYLLLGMTSVASFIFLNKKNNNNENIVKLQLEDKLPSTKKLINYVAKKEKKNSLFPFNKKK